ncbi:hypothetical protein FRC06_007989 [Ceratobasidium sp. 370]|nr:hypothetical protein FRC06_007989 [Ceratobasidium sp. 370]
MSSSVLLATRWVSTLPFPDPMTHLLVHGSILLSRSRGVAFATLVSANRFAIPSAFHRLAPRSIGITWAPCEQDDSRQCGRFEVPLDYQNESAGGVSLAVARYPATKQPKAILNPAMWGGVELVLGGNGDKVMRTVSGHIARAGIEARGDFSNQADLDAFYAQVPSVDKLLIEFGQRCREHSPDVLPYVGTTATVRDMVALHVYLEGPDQPVNFWGLSYGTTVGIYFVNMSPNRVGRVVPDGVSDPLYWANIPPPAKWAINVESSDEALTGFVSACAAAGPGISSSTKDWIAPIRDDEASPGPGQTTEGAAGTDEDGREAEEDDEEVGEDVDELEVDEEPEEAMEYDVTKEANSFATAGSSRGNEHADESFRSAT